MIIGGEVKDLKQAIADNKDEIIDAVIEKGEQAIADHKDEIIETFE